MDDWRLNHEFGHRLLYPVFDPLHGRLHEHLFVIASLFGAFLLWGLLLFLLLPDGGNAVFNLATHQMLQSLHTPTTMKAMVLITQLGSLTTILPFYILLGIWFWYRGYFSHYLVLGVLILLGEGLVVSLKTITGVVRPFDISGLQAGAFPSGHVLMSTLFYGALSIIIASRLPYYRRWIPYLVLILLLFAMAFSRLYLGAHWASDVLAAFAIAVPLLIIGGIVIYRLQAENGHRLWLPVIGITLILLLVQGSWRFDSEWQRYQMPSPERQTLTTEQWLDSGGQALPLHRNDLLEGNQPFNLQWQGNAEAIQAYLTLHGWQRLEDQSYSKVLQWFNPNAQLQQLMVPNHIHGTAYQDQLWLRLDGEQQRWQVLRLWYSHWQSEQATPYWIGNMSYLEIHSRVGIRYLATLNDYPTILEQLEVNPPLQCKQTDNDSVPLLLCRFAVTSSLKQ
jgi:undecaprenyl-diphosphatase